jgi:outer membrane lipase/esterase
MKKIRVLATAIASAAFLAACGGSGAGDQQPRVAFTQMVNFGDSLSDVGTYRTTIIAANGGGRFSINGDLTASGLLYTNWTEFLAATLKLTAPCPAETGLQSVGQLSFLAQPIADSTTCLSYAQGGSEVSGPYGPSNAFYYTQYGQASGQLGQITKPVTAQIAAYLAGHGKFSDGQLITVLAGGNDLFINRALTVDAQVAAVGAALAAGQITQAQAGAKITQFASDAVAQMTAAGTALADLVKTQIIANGGTHVVVVNLPDVSKTPDNAVWVAGAVGTVVEPLHPHLTLDMTNAFNAALAAGLSVTTVNNLQTSSMAEVTWVDAFTNNDDQFAHPASYALTNTTTPACKLTPSSANDTTATGLTIPNVGFIPLASSLFCTKNTLITDTANVTSTDSTGVMHYLYADTVHPTPWGYRLLAQLVGEKMAIKGWL